MKANAQPPAFRNALVPVIAEWRSGARWEDKLRVPLVDEGSLGGVDMAEDEVVTDPHDRVQALLGDSVPQPEPETDEPDAPRPEVAADGEEPDSERHDVEAHPGFVEGVDALSVAHDIMELVFTDIGIPPKAMEGEELP